MLSLPVLKWSQRASEVVIGRGRRRPCIRILILVSTLSCLRRLLTVESNGGPAEMGTKCTLRVLYIRIPHTCRDVCYR